MLMKTLKSLSILAMLAFLVTIVSCGDDDPGVDEQEDLENPVVTITAPEDGKVISTLDATTSVTINYTVTDDVEIASVVVDFNGTQLAEITTFADFKNYVGEEVKSDVADGQYTITITATDKAGKTASATSTFTKETSNPYTPLDNEVMYFSFEGNYTELISEEDATVVGSPTFAGEGAEGDDAYAGATDAYLTIPTTAINSTTLTVSLFMKINNDPDRAGILLMGAPDENNTEFQNNRNFGFRFFREASNDGATQRFKVNIGTGDSDVWLDGGALADVDPTVDEWHHFAFVIGETHTALYIDGEKAKENTEFTGMDITGCDVLSIMSGVPRFTEWSHFSDLSYLDDLKIFNKAMTEEELEALIGIEFGEPQLEDPGDPGLTPIDGDDATEVLYMSFDTDFSISVSDAVATAVGNAAVVDGGVSGKAYSGDADSYLTIPATGLLNDSFSASMWIKMDPEATRASMLAISAADTENPDSPNNRNFGLRFFREGDATQQTFKLNVGTGDGEVWIDGGAFATFSATREDWLHLAITVGGGQSQVYLNGILAAVSTSETDPVVDWTGCETISFGSGAPNFTGWGHIGETGLLDEFRLYSGVLTPAQIASLKAAGN
jgi:hypothetical protein